MKQRTLIIILSFIIPLLILVLYIMPKYNTIEIDWLPKLNAFINGTVFCTLICAFIAIKKRRQKLHKKLIYIAFGLTIIFLISYFMHHSTHESVKYGGEGAIKNIYYFVLISHIILAAIITPLVLLTLSKALKENFVAHKKLARVTLPLWLYVTFTGVLVYFMIAPYY